MIELKVHEFTSILPLLVGIKQKVLPYAICEGFSLGRVFVDRRKHPQTALIFFRRGNWRSHIPSGFRLQPVDAALAKQAGALTGWASFDDFITNGFGFALLEGDKLASICTSAFASRERVEIEIHTAEDCRRRGFSMLTASALIEKCLSSGKLPNWECFWDNAPSTALAGKLGFSPLQDYPVYYWEEKFIATTAEAAQEIK